MKSKVTFQEIKHSKQSMIEEIDGLKSDIKSLEKPK